MSGTLELVYWDSHNEDNSGDVSVSITRTYEVACPVCGDGEVNQESEECDDGQIVFGRLSNQEGDDYCNDACKLVPFPVCGDGTVNQEGEQCDDGNENNSDSCSNTCQTRAFAGGGGAASSI